MYRRQLRRCPPTPAWRRHPDERPRRHRPGFPKNSPLHRRPPHAQSTQASRRRHLPHAPSQRKPHPQSSHVPLRPGRPFLSQYRSLWQHLLRLPSHRSIRVARRQSYPTHISYRLRSLWRGLQLGHHPCSPRINSCIQASFLHKMTMSENRQSGSPPDEKICTWNCPIEKFAIAHCRAVIHASTASSSSASPQPASIAGPSAQPAPQNTKTSVSSPLPPPRRKRASAPASAAAPRPLPTWRHGAEPQTPSPAPLLSSLTALSTATAQP